MNQNKNNHAVVPISTINISENSEISGAQVPKYKNCKMVRAVIGKHCAFDSGLKLLLILGVLLCIT